MSQGDIQFSYSINMALPILGVYPTLDAAVRAGEGMNARGFVVQIHRPQPEIGINTTGWALNAEAGKGVGGATGSRGTAAGGGGGGSGAGQIHATQFGQPYTGGGQYYAIGAVDDMAVLPQREEEFLGVDTLTPDEKLLPGYSPDAVNWDGLRKIGSRCVRAGVAKLNIDIRDLDDGEEEEEPEPEV